MTKPTRRQPTILVCMIAMLMLSGLMAGTASAETYTNSHEAGVSVYDSSKCGHIYLYAPTGLQPAGASYQYLIDSEPYEVTGDAYGHAMWPGKHRLQLDVNGVRVDQDEFTITRCNDDPTTPPAVNVIEMAGANRYETAALLAENFPVQYDTVYVATGLDFPDALAAGSRQGGQVPILLTRQDRLSAVTADFLAAKAPLNIIVLGGEAAVSANVEQQLDNYGSVRRIGGSNRYATAALLAAEFETPDLAYLATGLNFPDALAGAARAGSQGAPILLTRPNQLPDAISQVLAVLQPALVTVLGGEGQVSQQVYDAAGATGRISGSDRYQTALEISGTFGQSETVYITTGLDFPDALSAAPVAGSQAAPVLLTHTDRLPLGLLGELERLNPSNIVIIGGNAAVSFEVRETLKYWASLQ